jgi:hypothetical protein
MRPTLHHFARGPDPEVAEFLVTSKQAQYLFTVKANQPALLDRCSALPWHRVPVLDRSRDPRPHRDPDP